MMFFSIPKIRNQYFKVTIFMAFQDQFQSACHSKSAVDQGQVQYPGIYDPENR